MTPIELAAAAPAAQRSPDAMRTPTLRSLAAHAAAALLGLGLTASCTDSDDVLDGPPPIPPGFQTNNILDRAEDLGLNLFVELGRLSNFEAELRNAAPITVFAPNDAAFNALGTTRLDALRDPSNIDELDALIGRFLVAGDFDRDLLAAFSTLVTATGDVVQIAGLAGITTIDEGRIVDEDPEGDNGRLFVLDAVPEVPLTPIASLERAGLTTMVQLIDAAGLRADVDSGDFTVLAPTEAAFAALPAGELDALQQPGNLPQLLARLRFHLVEGTQTFGRLNALDGAETEEGALLFAYAGGDAVARVNGAILERGNRPTTGGGMIHELDAFLEVPPTLTDVLTDPDLDTLELLLATAALVPTLESLDPVTLFAPNEAAFAALPAGAVADLQLPQNAAQLQTLLESHAVATGLPAPTLADGDMLTTLSASTIEVTDDGALLLDAIARIDTADVFIRNGVVHVIDAVLAADGL